MAFKLADNHINAQALLILLISNGLWYHDTFDMCINTVGPCIISSLIANLNTTHSAHDIIVTKYTALSLL